MPSSSKTFEAAPPVYRACPPRLDRKPSASRVAARPPRIGAFSKMVTPTPSRARKQATVRPAIPPPTTATSVCASLGFIPVCSFPSVDEGSKWLERCAHLHDAERRPCVTCLVDSSEAYLSHPRPL